MDIDAPGLTLRSEAVVKQALYVQFTNPGKYPPLQHSSQILARDGWTVQFIGVEDRGSGADMTLPPHSNVSVRKLSAQPPGWRQKVQYLLFALAVLAYTLRHRPAVLYVSDPLACPAALAASFLSASVLLYHEHDTPNSALERSGFMQMVEWARQVTARRADLCVLPNAQRAAHFARETGVSEAKVHTVWNCPERRQVASLQPSDTSAPSGTDEPVLRVIYLGSIVPDRVPRAVVEAAGRVEGRVEIELVGYETIEHPQYVEELRTVAEQCGVDDCFTYAGAMPHDDALRYAATHDVGLALMPPEPKDINMRWMIGASNKSFDYLASGVPLLVTDLPEWRDTFADSGLARACDPQDPGSIADAFQWLFNHPEERRRMGRRGRQRLLDDWNYESEFEEVKHLLENRYGEMQGGPSRE